MQGQVVIVTGASDGIGRVTAQTLTRRGAQVVVVGRSADKTASVGRDLSVAYYVADFADLAQVRDLARQLLRAYPHIDGLINNAGGIFGRRELTVDGHEKTWQVNHLAPFLLTNELLPALLASRARIINVSSIANWRFGDLDMDDLDMRRRYSPNRAYGTAKLANILFTQELHRRYYAQGIAAVAVHPGTIATNFASQSTSWLRYIYRTVLAKIVLEAPAAGAEPLIWLATSTPGADWQPGRYYEKHRIGRINHQAEQPGVAERLWEASLMACRPQASDH